MTDRVHALTVVLDRPVREDDIDPVIEAIKQLRHVIKVTPHVADMDTYAAEERAVQHISTELFRVLKEWHHA